MARSQSNSTDKPLHGPPAHVTAEGVEPHPHKTGHRTFDLLVTGSVILISVISLFIAVDHGRTMQKLVAANSWPLLQAGSGNNHEGKPLITMMIRNVGIGPAIIKSFHAEYHGRRYTNPHKFLEACCARIPVGPDRKFELGDPLTNFIDQTVIGAGQERAFLMLELAPKSEAAWIRLDKERFNVRYHACYCSVLGTCWDSDLTGINPVEVKNCPAPNEGAKN